jgi:hypothetical protein
MTLCMALGLLSIVRAQTQERSLAERLLRPDMNLQNSAQNKKFVADVASVDKHATVATFYVENKRRDQSFAGTRDFSTTQFRSQSFHERDRTDVAAKKQSAASSMTYPTSSMEGLRSAHASHKSAGSRDFAGQRPFLGQGKSQKKLDRKNPPLTIKQVRELLNKNK